MDASRRIAFDVKNGLDALESGVDPGQKID